MKIADVIVIFSMSLILMFLGCKGAEKKKHVSDDNVCLVNLKNIATAIHNLDSDIEIVRNLDGQLNSIGPSSIVFLQQLAQTESLQTRMLVCPTDVRTRANNFEELSVHHLSYFLSSRPGNIDDNWIIAGDRNIEVSVTRPHLPFKSGFVRWSQTPLMHDGYGWLVRTDTTVFKATNGIALAVDITESNIKNEILLPLLSQ